MSAAGVRVGWALTDGERARAVTMLAGMMTADADYISHSELQYGLSLDGVSWAVPPETVAAGYLEWLLESDGVEVAHAVDAASGALVGVAVVTWHSDTPTPFATLQDMAVAPAVRGGGVGRQLVAFVEAETVARDHLWLFLESGRRNRRAHAFFERLGFGLVSHSFAKSMSRGVGE